MSAAQRRTGRLWLPIIGMAIVVLVSNVAVQYPFTPWGLEDYLTWGAFTYPVAFLITDLTNRRHGAATARRLVIVGFVLAVIVSIAAASPRIALASGAAFLVGQLLDVSVFNRLRRLAWWRAPLLGSLAGSAIDTALFFSIAFAGDLSGTATYGVGDAQLALPVWVGWATCDFLVKMAMALLMLVPYGALVRALSAEVDADTAKRPVRS
ncbi:queuosine precursor transporter [Chelatococcus sp. SYSU_G07232]|uniref:Probable queuosine precursor transporter n=1 Tax=Chelatococcus albus TaxID=3047466 RepID=A0ABT7ADE3_9HYPH|nr:queuosine precursor transporter [Chelatococcus sp. SYSU_G07232]MDJ1157401.1 queuosine precursor transporter [Chelatococcus sp. SYSU_G07232]